MKVIALILTMNVLIATNGIAITEHFCSMLDEIKTELPVDNQESDSCCRNTIKDFVKQDIDGNISSAIDVYKSIQTLPEFLLLDLFCFNEANFISPPNYKYPPPLPEPKEESKVVLFQAFRC